MNLEDAEIYDSTQRGAAERRERRREIDEFTLKRNYSEHGLSHMKEHFVTNTC